MARKKGPNYDPNWNSDDYNNIPEEDKKKEIWKPIIINGKDTECKVSNMGRAMNKDGRILRPSQDFNGYLLIKITFLTERFTRCLHRLVIEAFIENPDPEHLTQVNHKDENPKNNRLSNLEYCSRSYNMNYGSIRKKITASKKGKSGGKKENTPVLQYDLSGKFIAEYPSVNEAKRVTGASVDKCFLKENPWKTAGKSIWLKKEGDEIPQEIDPTPYLSKDYALERIGEKRMMNCGLEAVITKAVNSIDISIRFENGITREHIQYGHFKKGMVLPLPKRKPKCPVTRHKEEPVYGEILYDTKRDTEPNSERE